MVGPFKRSKDKKTHLLVAVDKFAKWVEAEPVSKCDAATAVQFMKRVIFRFGFPHSIITDNGTVEDITIRVTRPGGAGLRHKWSSREAQYQT